MCSGTACDRWFLPFCVLKTEETTVTQNTFIPNRGLLLKIIARHEIENIDRGLACISFSNKFGGLEGDRIFETSRMRTVRYLN